MTPEQERRLTCKRWLVVTEAGSVFAWLYPTKLPLEFKYYRWRWLARLNVFLHNLAPPMIPSMFFRSRLIGRMRTQGTK